jgi:hypothetical protein
MFIFLKSAIGLTTLPFIFNLFSPEPSGQAMHPAHTPVQAPVESQAAPSDQTKPHVPQLICRYDGEGFYWVAL